MASHSLKKSNLELHHKEIIAPLLRAQSLMLSEYSFANLYLFRKEHEYQLVYGNDLYIQGKTYDGHAFLMPTTVKSFEMLIQDEEALKSVDFCYPIPEEWAGLVPSGNINFKEEDSDYIYDALHLSRYDGRGLSKKRNLVKQFLDLYQPSSRPLLKDDALKLLSRIPKKEDQEACIEAVENLSLLDLEGTVYYVEDVPVGLVIGEQLTDDTFCIHFAKADTSYKGVYQYINQEFAKSLVDRVQFINMEQDLGSPELRQTKHSYEPLRYCKKLRYTYML